MIPLLKCCNSANERDCLISVAVLIQLMDALLQLGVKHLFLVKLKG